MPIVNQTYIAKKLKISRATVSEALSNADDISEEMKKRICKFTEKENYILRNHASNLFNLYKKAMELDGSAY